MKQIPGQMSLFDLRDDTKKRKPCEYSFKRRIGQRVQFKDGTVGTITDIEPYYTEVMSDAGRALVGSPYDIWPLRTCSSCAHWQPYTHGWEPAPVGYTCSGFGIAKSNSADKPACDTYEEREEDRDDYKNTKNDYDAGGLRSRETGRAL